MISSSVLARRDPVAAPRAACGAAASGAAAATDRTSTSPCLWTSISGGCSWTGGGTPAITDNYTIAHDVTVTAELGSRRAGSPSQQVERSQSELARRSNTATAPRPAATPQASGSSSQTGRDAEYRTASMLKTCRLASAVDWTLAVGGTHTATAVTNLRSRRRQHEYGLRVLRRRGPGRPRCGAHRSLCPLGTGIANPGATGLRTTLVIGIHCRPRAVTPWCCATWWSLRPLRAVDRTSRWLSGIRISESVTRCSATSRSSETGRAAPPTSSRAILARFRRAVVSARSSCSSYRSSSRSDGGPVSAPARRSGTPRDWCSRPRRRRDCIAAGGVEALEILEGVGHAIPVGIQRRGSLRQGGPAREIGVVVEDAAGAVAGVGHHARVRGVSRRDPGSPGVEPPARAGIGQHLAARHVGAGGRDLRTRSAPPCSPTGRRTPSGRPSCSNACRELPRPGWSPRSSWTDCRTDERRARRPGRSRRSFLPSRTARGLSMGSACRAPGRK